MVKVNSKSQRGRSMVEMLGVLAIIGVLSVGGVYGYGVAMKKHKANELLHQASMLAATVSAQIESLGGDLPETITDFGSTNYGKFSTSVTQTEDKKKFVLTIENVDSAVCDQLKTGGMVQGVECNPEAKTAKITYYKNLATNDEEGKNSPTGGEGYKPVDCSENANECTGCQICQDGICVDSEEKCENGICLNGSCLCSSGRISCGSLCCPDGQLCVSTDYYGKGDYTCATPTNSECTKNSDCSENQFCDFKSFVGWEHCHKPEEGVCKDKGSLEEFYYNGKTFFLSDVAVTWWGAENLCLRHNKKLTSLSSLGLSKTYTKWVNCLEGTFDCDGEIVNYPSSYDDCMWYEEITCTKKEEYGPLYKTFGGALFWTSTMRDSCAVYYVQSGNDLENVLSDHRDWYYYALCE